MKNIGGVVGKVVELSGGLLDFGGGLVDEWFQKH